MTSQCDLAKPKACEQAKPIQEVRSEVGIVKTEVITIGATVFQLCKANAELITEFKDMVKSLNAHMIDNKEHSLNIAHLREGQDTLFVRVRRIEDDLIPKLLGAVTTTSAELKHINLLPARVEDLEEWKAGMKGVILVVPIVCTVLSTVAAIVALVATL